MFIYESWHTLPHRNMTYTHDILCRTVLRQLLTVSRHTYDWHITRTRTLCHTETQWFMTHCVSVISSCHSTHRTVPRYIDKCVHGQTVTHDDTLCHADTTLYVLQRRGQERSPSLGVRTHALAVTFFTSSCGALPAWAAFRPQGTAF